MVKWKMRDPKSLTDSLEGFNPTNEEQKEKARVTVCHHSKDAEEAAITMKMLGIYPGQHDEEIDAFPLPRMPGGYPYR